MPEDDKLLYCSFCGMSQHDVLKLIAGPSVFICEKCTDKCIGIILEENKEMSNQVKASGEMGMPILESLIQKAQDREN